jgi:hypothetical protein
MNINKNFKRKNYDLIEYQAELSEKARFFYFSIGQLHIVVKILYVDNLHSIQTIGLPPLGSHMYNYGRDYLNMR